MPLDNPQFQHQRNLWYFSGPKPPAPSWETFLFHSRHGPNGLPVCDLYPPPFHLPILPHLISDQPVVGSTVATPSPPPNTPLQPPAPIIPPLQGKTHQAAPSANPLQPYNQSGVPAGRQAALPPQNGPKNKAKDEFYIAIPRNGVLHKDKFPLDISPEDLQQRICAKAEICPNIAKLGYKLPQYPVVPLVIIKLTGTTTSHCSNGKEGQYNTPSSYPGRKCVRANAPCLATPEPPQPQSQTEGKVTLDKLPNVKQFDLKKRARTATEKHAATPIMPSIVIQNQMPAALGDATNLLSNKRKHASSESDSSTNSDDESTNIGTLLTKLNDKYPALKFPQYKDSLEKNGIGCHDSWTLNRARHMWAVDFWAVDCGYKSEVPRQS
ncbi:hypothetical protein M407DRAFT_33523 [Tulasnella calospora MUT 4182]|uniref:Uncharacterized protein n=1 Tax=Tulasnella calospora MUT 4182 TaxID=1051891 RepID=A0A0C3Q2X2_9AGAM|nr:hypothetical protein M407DRAFT_33523 [Tulasnella calospora MUT 4182]